MASRTLTTANQITILRLVFVPLFAILAVDGHFRGALAVLAAAAASDLVDGTVARVLHQESPLGVALDPIADKILMTTAYLILAFRGALPWWLTIVVLSRDAGILVTAAVISLVAGYRPFRPTLLGKASTGVQVTTVFVAVAVQARLPLASHRVLDVCILATAALTVASALHYLVVARNRFAHPSGEAEAR
ncbi:MAG TPA: CDP-alcohol phosphatidyltransferase family protein [Terriglobia bacterium]|nr:CDP-alcohol phosphatidyltransferase family protein [Terriglobia bacterium]